LVSAAGALVGATIKNLGFNGEELI